MFWSGETWVHRGSDVISDGFNVKNIDCAAYKLRVGREYYVTPNYSDKGRSSSKKYLVDWADLDKSPWLALKLSGGFSIPPGQFAFIITEETLAIPNNCLGFISLKTSKKFEGLVNVSGFHVDPGYKGKLIYAVFNAGPNKISISRRDKLFSLWLSDLKDVKADDFAYSKEGISSINSEIVSKVSSRVYSVQDLSGEIVSIKEKIGRVYWLMAILVGIIPIILIVLINFETIWGRLVPLFTFPAP